MPHTHLQSQLMFPRTPCRPCLHQQHPDCQSRHTMVAGGSSTQLGLLASKLPVFSCQSISCCLVHWLQGVHFRFQMLVTWLTACSDCILEHEKA